MSASLTEVLTAFILLALLTLLIEKASLFYLKENIANDHFKSALIEMDSLSEMAKVMKLDARMIKHWQKAVKEDLPNGKGTVMMGENLAITISFGASVCSKSNCIIIKNI